MAWSNVWWVPVAINIVLTFGVARWLGKKYIFGDNRTKRLFVQYATCFSFAVILAFAFNELQQAFTSAFVVWFIGFGNGIACFYYWKAQDISMGKTSVFTIWDDIIAMSLSYVVLGEGRFINAWTGSGIVLSLLALMLFARHAYKRGEQGGGLPMSCFGYIGIYSLLWGVAMFTERYFSADNVPVATFLFAWYGGSVIAALGILLFVHEKEPRQQGSLSLRDIGITIAYSLLILVCLAVLYWAYKTPQVIVQPIFFVAEAIVPVAVSYIFFREQKGEKFDVAEWTYYCAALLAVALIFIGYR